MHVFGVNEYTLSIFIREAILGKTDLQFLPNVSNSRVNN